MAITARVNFCIYCGAPGKTSEHWLPKWLGGENEIEGASCTTCQDRINREIENPLSRGVFWSARTHFGFKSHSGNRGPIKLMLVNEAGERMESIDQAFNPAILVMPGLPPPTLLNEGDEIGEKKIVVSTSILSEEKYRVFCEAYPGQSVSVGDFYFEKLCRLLAKIAHGLAVEVISPRRFKPTLARLILNGSRGDLEKYVGGYPYPWEEVKHETHAHTFSLGEVEVGGKLYYTVDVQLFSAMGMPKYLVVVGEKKPLNDDGEFMVAWGVK